MTRAVSLTIRVRIGDDGGPVVAVTGRDAWALMALMERWRAADARQSTIPGLGGRVTSITCGSSASSSKRFPSDIQGRSRANTPATYCGRRWSSSKTRERRHEAALSHTEGRRRGFCLAGTFAPSESADDHGRVAEQSRAQSRSGEVPRCRNAITRQAEAIARRATSGFTSGCSTRRISESDTAGPFGAGRACAALRWLKQRAAWAVSPDRRRTLQHREKHSRTSI